MYTYYRLTIGKVIVESSALLDMGNIFAKITTFVFLLQINCYEISPANNSDAWLMFFIYKQFQDALNFYNICADIWHLSLMNK